MRHDRPGFPWVRLCPQPDQASDKPNIEEHTAPPSFLPTTTAGALFFSSGLRMFSLFFLLFHSIQISVAFTLSLPEKFDSGTLVTVQWTRDGADPPSFGLMQRSLQGNENVLSITPVETNGASSGSTEVAFNTPGQVLLSVVSQLSLSTGERPNQLSAGKQLTVVPSNNAAVQIPGTTTSSRTTVDSVPTKTTAPATTQTTDGEDSDDTKTETSTSVLTIPSTTSKTIIAATWEKTTKTTFASGFSTLSSARRTLTAASTTAVAQLSQSAVPASSSIQTTTTSSASPKISSAAASQGLGKPGMTRNIALAVVFPVLFLVVIFCVVRYQRSATRDRVNRFRRRWMYRATISSFGGNDVESAMVSGHASISSYR
ncbi:hypothetical protein C8R43DRAFT_1133070 [Mycena crocata]|nr:hypothetical protein C8R43DRAFT_1133070 [Mycena crocata]